MAYNPKRTARRASYGSKSKSKQLEECTVKDLPSLRRKRTIALNRILKALEVGILAQSDDSQHDLFFSYCDQVEKIKSEFELAHLSILELFDTPDGDEDDDMHDGDTLRTRFDDAYFRIKSIRRYLTKFESTVSNTSGVGINRSSALSNVKLPKIQLPTFSGDIKQWPEFYDTFKALIHDCSSLTGVEKFHYLISSLSGDPLLHIRTFPVTGDYYSDAFAALTARYHHKRELAFTCWKDILDVSFKLQNAIEFRRALDCIDENLNILRKQDLPVDQWDFVLVYHVLSKLDSKMRREFEEKYCHTELPRYLPLKEFLHSKCEALLRDSHFSDISKSTQGKDTTKFRFPAKPLAGSYPQRSNVSHSLLADVDRPIQNNNDSNNVTNNNKLIKCPLCSDVHYITKCKAFLAKSVDERMSFISQNNLCFNCLKSSHQLKECVSIFRCLKCKHKHHTLLHNDRAPNRASATDIQSVSLFAKGANASAATKSSSNTTVLLATAMVQIKGSDGQYHSFRALFDSGSQNNFITRHAAECLNFKSSSCDANVHGLGGISANIFGVIRCSIASHNNPLFELDLHIISNICGEQPISKLNTLGWSHINSLPLADPGFDIPGPIDILLGADIFAESILNECIRGTTNQPLAMNSVFGWLLFGRTPLVTYSLFSSKSDNDLTSIVQRFWELDNLPQVSPLTPEEITCELAYATDHNRDPSGRYVVRLPFKDNVDPVFMGSRDIALRRFRAIERRLSRDPGLHKQYSEFMEDYEKSGHMSLVEPGKMNQGRFYIPHHCVLKPDSATTKLRVVFDASAKDANGKSLNDTLLTGPKLQSNIIMVLLQFRIYAFVFMADIRQMYRQILVTDEHRDYQRIFWRAGPDQALQEYRLNTVTYGVSSAPFLACRTIQQLAKDEGSHFPLAKEILATDIYIDDVVSGCQLLKDALEAKSQIINLFKRGHFQLRKWASNSPSLLSDLSQEECLLNPKSFSDGQLPTLKVLGLKWDPVTDSFLFDVRSSDRVCTKRVILSEIARVFDPLGFLAPLTILSKCLMQKLWILGVSWDEVPPEIVQHKWSTFCSQLPSLTELRIPRRLTADNVHSYELHGFCDSSEVAYGAVIYLRALCADGSIQIRLVCAKARVAPLKKLSLPRLELCGAVMLADLAKIVVDTYQTKTPISKTYLWSDSTVVLSWLRSHSSRWTTFVANRVSHIQEIAPAELWRHVVSGDNPADVCSRGQLPLELLHNSLWWAGPSWLSQPSNFWPILSKFPTPSDDEELVVRTEERTSVVLIAPTSDQNNSFIDKLLNRYSSLEKITRIVSYIRRFINNIRTKDINNRVTGSILNEFENHQALLAIVKSVQNSSFSNEIQQLNSKQPLSKPFRKLNPFLDEANVLRVGGRISRSGLEFEQKHPALLPCDHPLTSKLIESIHRQNCHTGQNTTQYLVLQRFWILSAKRAIRRCLSKCIRCFRTCPKPLEPYMSDLPSYRVNQVKPFSVVGVDFGGPFRIKVGTHRGAKIDKAYLCLFVCLATKAVHLEVVSTLSTDGFLAALRRFVGRRGRCNVVHADCGTNFVGASNYLLLLEQASQAERIKFEFNPPSAPHFGGVWEIQIKAAKSHLYRIVGNQVLTFEELTTLFVQIESVLNSRPLCALSTDPNDLNVLTPGHFLTLEPLTSVPDEDYSNVKLYRLNRWQLIQSFLRNFWVRWKHEYLNSLIQRAKWTKASEPLSLNSIVVIKDDSRTPLQWSLGRVVDLHPGLDGIVRVATIKTRDSLMKRPLVKLCPLPVDS